ncbi:MAG: hypothetical protein KH045_12330 [Megamonas funiformis]|jgi:hypothetical protein|uniref:hypothetical protein n=1 Tax=Megamonas funiformis TaxID=437897 RepID=UPI001EC2CD63|nr:hypothetical protein [Megamonas funiformis]MBS7213301.1 hypothetical protein [Megamonas funiformis]
MATNVKYYCMAFLKDGTPSVRIFANTKDIEKNNEKYIAELKQKVKKMTEEELFVVDIISASDYDLYVNGDGTNTYVRDMETGKPKIYIPPEPTKEELQAQALANLESEYNAQKEGFKKDLDTANLAGNTEAIKSIQEEYMEFNAAYEEAKNEILKDE